MAYPAEELRQEALLCLIYLRGRKENSIYQLKPDETYEPLADFFGLTESQRNEIVPGDPWTGKNRSNWEIHVQGTRERLAGAGYIKRPPPRGIWRLTSDGIKKAESLVHKYTALALVTETPQAKDFNAPSETSRIATTIYRVLRDTQLARRVKMLHNYECQICGETIKLSSGEKYAEAHHIKPLGTPHNGPDIAENIICVCPNHHVKLDYGVMKLELSEIKVTSQHSIGTEYIDYHNQSVFERR
jgi:hypothetical protein